MLRTYLQDEEILWVGQPNHQYNVFVDKGDKRKSLFIYLVGIFFFLILGGAALLVTIDTIQNFAEMEAAGIDRRPIYLLMGVLWTLALSLLLSPLFFVLKKKFVINKQFSALKYTLTDKAAYISVDREGENLVRLPYIDMNKVACSSDKKDKNKGNIIFQMKYPIQKKKISWWSFDFENTINPEFSKLDNVQEVFEIIKRLTVKDVLHPNFKKSDNLLN